MSQQEIEIFDAARQGAVPAIFHDEMRADQFTSAEAS